MEHGLDLPSCGVNLQGGQDSRSETLPDPVLLQQLELTIDPEHACEPPVIPRPSILVRDNMVPLSDTDREDVGGDAKQEWIWKKTLLRIDS